MFRDSNIGVLILNGRGVRYSNFQILTRNPRTSRYSMPSAKQQPSNIKHDGGIRPNECPLTFAPLPPFGALTAYTITYSAYRHWYIIKNVVNHDLSTFYLIRLFAFTNLFSQFSNQLTKLWSVNLRFLRKYSKLG